MMKVNNYYKVCISISVALLSVVDQKRVAVKVMRYPKMTISKKY